MLNFLGHITSKLEIAANNIEWLVGNINQDINHFIKFLFLLRYNRMVWMQKIISMKNFLAHVK